MLWLWILVAVLVVLALALVTLYNRLVRLRNRTENAWSQVDVQLKAALRPDPEPRRDRQGLRRPRAPDVRGGDGRAHTRPAGERRRRSRPRPRTCSPRRSAASSPSPRRTPSSVRARTSSSSRQRADRHGEQDRRRAPGLQRHRTDLRQRDPDDPGEPLAGPLRLHLQALLRGRGAGTRGAAGPLLALVRRACGGAGARRRPAGEVVHAPRRGRASSQLQPTARSWSRSRSPTTSWPVRGRLPRHSDS